MKPIAQLLQNSLWVDRSEGSTSTMGPCSAKGTSKSTLDRESNSLSSAKWSELISESLHLVHPYSLELTTSSVWDKTQLSRAKKKHRKGKKMGPRLDSRERKGKEDCKKTKWGSNVWLMIDKGQQEGHTSRMHKMYGEQEEIRQNYNVNPSSLSSVRN